MLATFFQDIKGRIVSQKHQAIVDAFKALPAVGVAAWESLTSVPVEKWVSGATLLYVLLQMFFLVRDRRHKSSGEDRFFNRRRAK